MSETLGLTQLGSPAHYPINSLRERISAKLPDFSVQELPPFDQLAEALDPSRGQYHSTRVLAILEELVQTMNVNFLLGVAPFDLYVPGMNFVFGEARCPGRVAVISTLRLKTDPQTDMSTLGSRVLKEAVHETGHMLGLRHCPDESCVMHFSERLSDTDRKNDAFCSDCSASLRVIEVE